MRLPTVQKRNGFTLVELLVVIAIIAILMALTVGVMSKVWNYFDEVKVTTEVGRISQACEQFKSTFGRYPPAKIILCENPVNYTTAPGTLPPGVTPANYLALAQYSSEYLSSVFPGLLTSGTLIDWSGSNAPGTGVFLLEGEESLVYFLSGLRPTGGAGAPIGFNTDKSRLTAQTTGARLGPFFEFEPSRIGASSNPYSGGRFPIYKDVFGTAYAYFYARTPGMNNYYFVGSPAFAGTGLSAAQQEFFSDCPTLTRRVGSATPDVGYVPLWQNSLGGAPPTAIQFFKADSYQIVSAGKDKLFGSGGQWNQPNPENSTFSYMNFPAPVATAVTDVQTCYDNITNVSNGRIVPK